MPHSPSNPCHMCPTRWGRSGRSFVFCVQGPVSQDTNGASPSISILMMRSICVSRKTSKWGTDCRTSLPTVEICDALQAAGFELLEAFDRAPESDPETPWYRALQGRDFRLSSLPRTPAGRSLTNLALRIGEGLRIAPAGSRKVSTLLNAAADALVDGGKSGVFTPMFFFLARKPEHSGG